MITYMFDGVPADQIRPKLIKALEVLSRLGYKCEIVDTVPVDVLEYERKIYSTFIVKSYVKMQPPTVSGGDYLPEASELKPEQVQFVEGIITGSFGSCVDRFRC